MKGLALLCLLLLAARPARAAEAPLDYPRLAVEITNRFFDQDFFSDRPLDAAKWRDLFWEEIGHYYPAVSPEVKEASLPAFQAGESGLRQGQIDFARKLAAEAKAPVSDSILFSALINGWLKGRDKYALWETAGDSRQWNSYLSGRLHGIGVRWAEQRGPGGSLKVEMVVPKAPAEEAGLKPGMEVIGLLIDGQAVDLPSTRGADLAARIGNARQVTLRTATQSYTASPRDIVFQEAQPSLEKEKGAPVLRVPHFDRGTAGTCGTLLAPVAQAPTLILDLRECGGGYTDAAIDLLGMLEGPGPIGVVWKYRDEVGRVREKPMSTQADRIWKGKNLVVRVSQNTASAAELMLMSLRQKPGVKVEGGATYGKTTSQDILRTGGNSELRLSVSQFSPAEG
ncbi:MAG: S41 family peptidase [Verrucomicrobium sp.]|nr:S41 family peptidase [Verrucomicrobium sp.]